jgi:hypothetical protein
MVIKVRIHSFGAKINNYAPELCAFLDGFLWVVTAKGRYKNSALSIGSNLSLPASWSRLFSVEARSGKTLATKT